MQASKLEYDRLIAEWLVSGRQPIGVSGDEMGGRVLCVGDRLGRQVGGADGDAADGDAFVAQLLQLGFKLGTQRTVGPMNWQHHVGKSSIAVLSPRLMFMCGHYLRCGAPGSCGGAASIS